MDPAVKKTLLHLCPLACHCPHRPAFGSALTVWKTLQIHAAVLGSAVAGSASFGMWRLKRRRSYSTPEALPCSSPAGRTNTLSLPGSCIGQLQMSVLWNGVLEAAWVTLDACGTAVCQAGMQWTDQ